MKTTMRTYRHEPELQEAALNMARNITIRSYDNGSSRDITRKSTTHERNALKPILYSALLALNHSEASRSDTDTESAILNAAEYMVIVTSSQICPETRNDPTGETHVNSYDTVYLPLLRYIQEWRSASRG